MKPVRIVRAPKTNLIGRSFGRLTVTSTGRTKTGQFRWRCACSCGTQTLVATNKLLSGRTASCGCQRRESTAKRNKENNPARQRPFGSAALTSLLGMYKRSARNRGIPWGISDAEAKLLFDGLCTYCGIAPRQKYFKGNLNGHYLYNGIDRLDSSLGYVPGNVASCCGTCNIAKGTKTYGEFMDWLLRIATHLKAVAR